MMQIFRENQLDQKEFEACLRNHIYVIETGAPPCVLEVIEPELHDRPVSKRIIDEWMRRV